MRRIPLSRRSHIIGFQALSTGTTQHESALERDFVTLTSFKDPSASITSQPITIIFRDDQRARRYTPDYLVRRSDQRSELIEVKYQADLLVNHQRLKPVFAAAQTWAEEHDATFRIATELDIRGPELENAKRLLPLRVASLDPQLTARARAVVGSLHAPTFRDVLAAWPAERSSALALLWRLIAHGVLRVELSAPITLDTLIRYEH